MKTKLKFLMVFTILSTTILSSCKDFFDIAPESSATTGNAYNTAADLESALIGVYQTLYTDYFIWENIVMSDVRSDNAYAGDDAEFYQFDNLAVSSLNSHVILAWEHLYNGIAKANLVIEKAPQIQDRLLDENNKRENIIAEAKFLRALYYFELTKLFGGVPLVKEFGKINPEEANIAKSTPIEVYNFIVEDLEAATILPAQYSILSQTKSKVTKGAVYALLAKVHAQRPDRDYSKVLQYCQEVEDLGYDLHESYDELFDGLNYNNKEAILLVQFMAGTDEGNWGPQLFLPPSLTGDDWRKYVTPSKNIIAAYDAAGDVIRKNAAVLFENVIWSDEFWKPCATSPGPVPFAYKFKHSNAGSSGDNVYLLRFDDILLLKAEALNELDRSSEALTPLNAVRDRVDLGAITTTDKLLLKDIILNERRLELAFEGYRWDDLVRSGKIVSTMNNLQEFKLTCNGGSTPMNFGMTNEKILMPIPQGELNRNPNLTPNP